jgi:ABC-type branched-subunit amino acid transport system ATPase component
VSQHLLSLEQMAFALIGVGVLLGLPRRVLTLIKRARQNRVSAPARETETPGEAAEPAVAGPAANLLSAQSISVTYAAGERAVTNASFTLGHHSATALVGRNGAGKSSLLYAIVGFGPGNEGRVTSGDVKWYPAERPAQSLGGLSPIRRCALGIVFVPAEGKVFDDLTVAQHLREAVASGRRRSERVPTDGRQPATESLLDTFPALRGRLRSRAGLLSGGERQQLAIAVAVARSAQLVVIDEASLGLAPVAINALTPVLRRLSRELARGLLIAEQNVTLAMSTADEVLLMDDGVIRERGATNPEFMKLIEDSYLGGHRLISH